MTSKTPAKPRKSTARQTHSEAEVRARYEALAVEMMNGLKKHELKEWMRETWDIEPRTMERYLSRAREILLEWWRFHQGSDSRIELVAQVADTFSKIMHDTKASNRDRIAAAIALSKLFGLDAPFKIAPTTPDGEDSYSLALSEMSEEELLLYLKMCEKAKKASGESAEPA